MNEEKTITAEAVTANPTYPTLDAIVTEVAKFLEALGEAIVTTVQNASDVMIVNVNQDTREQLDLLVTAGVAETRREAANSLIEEGLKSREGILGKVHETKAQIAALRQQMRTIVSN